MMTWWNVSRPFSNSQTQTLVSEESIAADRMSRLTVAGVRFSTVLNEEAVAQAMASAARDRDRVEVRSCFCFLFFQFSNFFFLRRCRFRLRRRRARRLWSATV